MSDNEDAAGAGLVQRFLTADEVYVYKIPPLKNAGGHRAEDWDLARPLETCRLVVERRGDALVLEFLAAGGATTADPPRLVCRSTVHAIQGKVPPGFLESVVDSSRYFAVRIQDGAGKEATIGFGFRDREKATDLREALQHYERSLTREASHLAEFKVPQLAAGETIHINVKGKAGGSVGDRKPKRTSGGGGGIPLLAKKPPANPDQAAAVAASAVADRGSAGDASAGDVPSKAVDKVAISMGNINLDEEHRKFADSENDEDSDGAVFTGDEKEWATEFDTK